jgi:hypothetical protein
VNNVPCEECEFCGEQYFKADTLRKIEADFKEVHVLGKQPKQEVRLPVKEFVEI